MCEDRMFTVPSGAQVHIDSSNFIETDIVISLEDAIDRDFEGFLDFISEQATGTEILSDISYDVIALTPMGIILTVTGDVSMILDSMEDSDNG